MKFIDLLSEEYTTLMSPFLDRLDEKSCSELEQKCEKYRLLNEKASQFARQNDFIFDFFEIRELSQETYSKEQMQALKNILNINNK